MKKIYWAVFALALSACTADPVKPTVALSPEQLRGQWLESQEQLSRIHRWSIKGKAAVRSRDESGTVSLFWQQTPEDFALKLVAPFGRGTLDIKTDEHGVVMLDAKQREHRAATAQGLVWMKTGWDIPFEDMQGWVLGLVDDPENPSIQVDAQGRTTRFQSKGWDISYPAYKAAQTPMGMMSLPRKIYIKSKSLVVKLIVGEWDIP